MSTAYSQGSNVGYQGGGSAYSNYGGYGQFAQRVEVTAEFARRLLLPDAVPVFLMTCTARIALNRGKVSQSAFEWNVPGRVLSVIVNNGNTSFTEVFTDGDVFSTPGTWNQSLTNAPIGQVRLLVNRFPARPITDQYIAVLEFTFATRPKSFRDRLWQPRIQSLPNLSFRVDAKFGGQSQVGGGKVSLANADGYFDQLDEINSFNYQSGPIHWDGGKAVLEMGLDLATDPAGGAMAESDYRVLGTWRVENTDKSDGDFILNLRELKTNIELELPFETYRREDYPALLNEDVGKFIPRGYGKLFAVQPRLLDATTRRFKVAGHPILSFDQVRIRRSLEETLDHTVTDWSLYSGAAYQSIQLVTVTNVKFNGTDLTEAKSPEKVVSTQGTWHWRDQVLYVNPSNGQTITSGTYAASVKNTLNVWQTTNFATRDTQKAEFTLGDDWDRSDEVAVDFYGRMKPDGTLMTNAADVVADLLDYAGEIQMDALSFDESRRLLRIGTDRWGGDVDHLSPALYISEKTTLRDIVGKVCEAVGASFFADFDGRWRFVVFNPVQGANLDYARDGLLRTFTEQQILGEVRKSIDAKDAFSKVKVEFNKRLAEKWAEYVTQERPFNRYVHDLNDLAIEERAPVLWRGDDALYYAQRLLTTEGQERIKYTFTLPLSAFFLLPTDKLHIQHTRYALDQVLEVLEVGYDLTGSKVKVTCGNQRGWGDSFGFWVNDKSAAAVPGVPPDSECWLKADGLPLSHGNRVAQWSDVSGRNRHASNTNAGLQPVFNTNQINGLPAVRFGKLSTLLPWNLLISTSGMNLWTEAEVFCLVRVDSDPGGGASYGNSIWGNLGTLSDSEEYPDSAGTIQETFFTSATKATVNPAPSLAAWRLYNVSSKSAEFTVRLDGTQIYQTLTNTFSPPVAGFAYLGSGATKHLNGWFAEFILFKRMLTAGERASVVQYLSDKYALALVAPSAAVASWDKNWTDLQAHQARQNYGYWQDANEVAEPLDPNRSYQAGRWW